VSRGPSLKRTVEALVDLARRCHATSFVSLTEGDLTESRRSNVGPNIRFGDYLVGLAPRSFRLRW
jgi:hypothetical protein